MLDLVNRRSNCNALHMLAFATIYIYIFIYQTVDRHKAVIQKSGYKFLFTFKLNLNLNLN